MRILFLITSLEYGGAERQLVNLARGLRERDHDVGVAVFRRGGPLEAELKDAGVRLFSLEMSYAWDVIRLPMRLASLLRRERPGVLYAYLASASVVAGSIKPMFPRLKVVMGVRASYVDFSRYSLKSRAMFELSRLFTRFADLIIANSRAGREYHVAHKFPAEKTIVIPNGIDAERFAPDPVAGLRVRREWQVRDDETLIGIVARLDPIKDHETFLRAAALLAASQRDVKFVCVGDGPHQYRRSLRGLCDELGVADRVIWAGARTDVWVVYNALDVLTLSSVGEGFPNVIGEAMACGVPCVVTDVGDSQWIVGDTGIVVPPQDPDALARGWQRCLELDRHGLGRRARARVIAQFSVPRLVALTERALCL